MYENEADNETMLVTIGEYKELVRAHELVRIATGYLTQQDRSYTNLEPLYHLLGVPRPGIKEV